MTHGWTTDVDTEPEDRQGWRAYAAGDNVVLTAKTLAMHGVFPGVRVSEDDDEAILMVALVEGRPVP